MRPSFQYQNVGVATVTHVGLAGKRGHGVSILVVQIEAMTQPSQAFPGTPTPRIVTLGGRIEAVAPLVCRHVRWHCVDHAQQQNVNLEAFLSGEQLRALDESRNQQGVLQLTVSLEAHLTGPNGHWPSDTTHTITLTSSDWARLLAELNFEDWLTFEVAVAGARLRPPLDKAASFVRAAVDRLHHRQLSDALTQCREALDVLQTLASREKPPWADWADRGKRDAWDMDARLLVMQASVRHMTHAGPHSEIGKTDEHVVRLVLIQTAALLRYYASRG